MQRQNNLSYDVVIVGGGIMGMSIARSLKFSDHSLKILILEKENRFGLHASGRNSGVLHAGFYYSPESLKAQFCRDGNLEMKSLAEKHNLEIRKVGKVVVATNEDELSRMYSLYDRGVANGVELQLLDQSKLEKYEPLSRTYGKFLWSPTTAIVDKQQILQALFNEIKTLGVDMLFNQKLLNTFENAISTQELQIKYRHLINTSGSGALSIAKNMGFGKNYQMIPFLGVYRGTQHVNLPLRTLVYPVPHPENPFLGTHFTITTEGLVKIGPTAQPVIFGEQYKASQGWNIRELLENSRAMKNYFVSNFRDVSELIISEFPQLFERGLLKKSALLVPSAKDINSWDRKPSGIRAQLLRIDTKKLEQDFVVEGDSNSTHLLNIVSPGWTSSIAFADWVVKEHVTSHM